LRPNRKKFLFKWLQIFTQLTNLHTGSWDINKKKAYDDITVWGTYKDDDGNILLLDIEHKKLRITIGLIYGANTNEGIPMYDDLENNLRRLKNKTIIIGGDFNATMDTRSIDINLDVFIMASIPSRLRSDRI